MARAIIHAHVYIGACTGCKCICCKSNKKKASMDSEAAPDEPQLKKKLLVLGFDGAGKSALLQRWCAANDTEGRLASLRKQQLLTTAIFMFIARREQRRFGNPKPRSDDRIQCPASHLQECEKIVLEPTLV